MNNNWIEKGDAALEAGESPIGMLWLKSEEMPNWRAIALTRIQTVLSDRLLEFAKANPYITIGALFGRRYGVPQEEFDQFVNDVVALFEGSIPHLCSLDYGRSPRRNMIMVNFSNTTLDEIRKKKDELRKKSIIFPNIWSILIFFPIFATKLNAYVETEEMLVSD